MEERVILSFLMEIIRRFKVTDRIEDKIQALKEQTNAYVHDIKRLVEGLAIPNRINLISYFTTSLNISYDPEQESFMFRLLSYS